MRGAVRKFSTIGKPIQCRAAVARGVNDLRVEDIVVAPPKAGEVRIKVKANALCHTDIYTLQGDDPEGTFPSILGHEAGAVVESVGEGVTNVKPGDHVIPCYQPQCADPQCIFCMRPGINLCPAIRDSQGKGTMSDGTSRFSDSSGDPLHHFMGCSTFSEYSVISSISAARIDPRARFEDAALLGCGVATGWGSVWNTSKVAPGETVAVFGLGAVGLSIVQAARIAGASRIFAIDVNAAKFRYALEFGATDVINPGDLREGQTIQERLIEDTGWGVEHTFECTGNTEVMRAALEASHRGWGRSVVVGVAAAGQEISTRPFQLVTGRTWTGTAFGGWKSRAQVPLLVARVLSGELDVSKYVTHEFTGVDQIPDAIDAMRASGDCLRAIVRY